MQSKTYKPNYNVERTYFQNNPQRGRTTTLWKDGEKVLEVIGIAPKYAMVAQYEGRAK